MSPDETSNSNLGLRTVRLPLPAIIWLLKTVCFPSFYFLILRVVPSEKESQFICNNSSLYGYFLTGYTVRLFHFIFEFQKFLYKILFVII